MDDACEGGTSIFPGLVSKSIQYKYAVNLKLSNAVAYAK
jgi:hypothetical protein